MHSIQSYDVIIIGAGVSGCACALYLADQALNIAIIERKEHDDVYLDYAETLPPECMANLRKLDIFDQRTIYATPCYGVQSAWGEDKITTRSFVSALPPYALRIDKNKLLKTMREFLTVKGVTMFFGSREQTVDTHENGGPESKCIVTFKTSSSYTHSLSAEFLVDASGRNRVVARKSTRIRYFDRLVASVAVFRKESPTQDLSKHMSITESVRNGWWYHAPLTTGGDVVIRFSDAHDRISGRIKNVEDFWSDLRRTRLIAKRLNGTVEGHADHITTVPATSTKVEKPAGANWVAIGDAARTVDPLSSQGIHNGLSDGIKAASLIVANAAESRFATYVTELNQSYDAYLDRRGAMYSLERRWPRETFWAVRRR